MSSPKPIHMDPNILNEHFCSTTQRLLGATPMLSDNPEEMINSLAYRKSDTFSLHKVTYGEVLQQLRCMRSDSSTGPDEILIS